MALRKIINWLTGNSGADDTQADTAGTATPQPAQPAQSGSAEQPFSVVITTPREYDGEVAIAEELFEAGLSRFHLRKSDWSLGAFYRWIEDLPEQYHKRLVLHAEPKIVRELKLGGLHLRSNYRKPKDWPADIPVSNSCHSFQNLCDYARGAAYATIGPVFPSVSKRGYEPQRTVEEFAEILRQWKAEQDNCPLLALGGLTAENIGETRKLGFDGFAVVGSVWDDDDPIAGFEDLLTGWQKE
ncbi:MAG: thiamine phosphate synthase [Puniceicoccales bacterium]|jgi:thiamine-phosphate pyrophosphorylase|nr:thiamine phosphate synthase [Puniceicoccales bacterium]